MFRNLPFHYQFGKDLERRKYPLYLHPAMKKAKIYPSVFHSKYVSQEIL